MPASASGVEIKPWGHALFLPIRDERGVVALQDIHGRRWGGVREAFWVSELHMCGCSDFFIDEQLQHMAKVLTACCLPSNDREPLADCFGEGGTIHMMFYMHWLAGIGLTDYGENPFEHVRPTHYGLSVLEMIRLTLPSGRGIAARWFPEPERPPVPRHQRRRGQKRLLSPDAVPA